MNSSRSFAARTPQYNFTPADHGLLAWSFPVTEAGNNSTLTAGVVTLVRVKLDTAQTISNVHCYIVTAGSGLTSGQCFGALFDTSGTRLGLSADQATAWASGGDRPMALTTPYAATAGHYYVALLANGTTPPALARSTSAGTPAGNYGLGVAASRFATIGTGQTAMPSTVAPASFGRSVAGFWAGLS